MGVSILPRLAATVCIHTTGTASARQSFGSKRPSTAKVKGTKVSRATSLVISILPKKHSPTSTSTKGNTPPVRPSSACPMRLNTPCPRSPAITVIRENKMASVRKSIYPA